MKMFRRMLAIGDWLASLTVFRRQSMPIDHRRHSGFRIFFNPQPKPLQPAVAFP